MTQGAVNVIPGIDLANGVLVGHDPLPIMLEPPRQRGFFFRHSSAESPSPRPFLALWKDSHNHRASAPRLQSGKYAGPAVDPWIGAAP